MDEKVFQLLTEQVNKEFYSAYLYLDFANFFEDKGLSGFANWYEVQAKEEMDHALLFYQYLHLNNKRVQLGAIDKPALEGDTVLDVLKQGLRHEEYVTGLIHGLYAAAQQANDFRATQFLDWFVKEQGEEENNAHDLISKMELFGSDARALYLLDSELKARVYTAPSLAVKG